MHHAMAVLSGVLMLVVAWSCVAQAEPLHEEHALRSSTAEETENLQGRSGAGLGGLAVPLSADGPVAPVVKRGWRQMQGGGGWGKRAWKQMNAGGGWGKREFPWQDKRTWQKFQGGWGKRGGMNNWQLADMGDESEWPLDEEMQYDPQQQDGGPLDLEDMLLLQEEEKRAWRSLNPTWGKRATDWESFRGSWGKRDPAWNNLKGLWGKRSSAADAPASKISP